MTKLTLRKKIYRIILRHDPKASTGYDLTDQILQAVSEYIEELIGEDGDTAMDDFDNRVIESQNILRQELREKLKEDLG